MVLVRYNNVLHEQLIHDLVGNYLTTTELARVLSIPTDIIPNITIQKTFAAYIKDKTGEDSSYTKNINNFLNENNYAIQQFDLAIIQLLEDVKNESGYHDIYKIWSKFQTERKDSKKRQDIFIHQTVDV